MGQIFDDFSAGALGDPLPSGWTDAVLESSLTGNEIVTGGSDDRVFRYHSFGSGGTSFRAAKFDTVGIVSGEVEVFAKVRSGTTNFDGAAVTVCGSGSLSSGDATGYSAQLFSDNELRLRKISGSGSSYIGSFALASTIAEGVWHNLRLQLGPSGALKAKVWLDTEAEPGTWQLEVTDTSFTSGWVGLSTGYQFSYREADHFGVGTNGDSAPTGPVSAGNTGETTDLSTASDSWSAFCAATASTTAPALASDSLSVIASISTSIISAAQASDNPGEGPAASVRLQSLATGSDSVDALASAAAALSAGAAAGELWTVKAQAVANMLDQASASDQIARATGNAINAALSEGSAAADQFLVAINALCSIQDSASATDAFVAAVVTIAGLSSGAIASDSFGVDFGHIKNIESGAISSDAWALMVSINASLSEVCTVQDLIQARANVTARVTFGAIATDTFAIVNAGIRYLVMGSIILRDALNYRVTHKPALNQSVKIKPGH